MYTKDKFSLDIDNKVYALESNTISLCLKLSPWARFCKIMGGIYLMDKGYVYNFSLFNNILKNCAFFVNRAKDNMQYEVVSTRAVDSQTCVISDQIIRLTEEVSIE